MREARLTRWVFLRALALVYLVAFASLGVQVRGLIGSRGISPAASYLQGAREVIGTASAAWRYLPTIFWCPWWGASDRALVAICLIGAVAALLLLAGVADAALLALLWVLYLSLVSVGQEFLAFQWDILLLETGFLAIFLAPAPWPLRLRPHFPGSDPPPVAASLWMMRWLLFRLMFASGVVKLASGDPNWRSLRALDFHFETQPLPTWIGWYAHQLPSSAHRLATGVLFAIELVVPFFALGPRRLRAVAFWPLVALQVVIALTGNYTFFNLLTVALCVLLLDDAMLPRWMRRTLLGEEHTSDSTPLPPSPAPVGRPWPRVVLVPVLGALALLSIAPMARLFAIPLGPAAFLGRAWRASAPFGVMGHYGLFAVMTTERDEIVIEGSDDGEHWKPYEFLWKPGDTARRPGFVAPHQPRLDWQMWFAALGNVRDNPWLLRAMVRLLEGEPDVLGLFASNPFPTAPPKQVRASLYRYHFSDPAERRRSGIWWRREPRGLYCQPIALRR